jgi:hypothetical protein
MCVCVCVHQHQRGVCISCNKNKMSCCCLDFESAIDTDIAAAGEKKARERAERTKRRGAPSAAIYSQ